MKEFFAVLTTCFLFALGLRYSYQVWKHTITPTLSTWISFLVGVVISLITFAIAEQKDFWSGTLNTMDVVVVSLITITIILRGERTLLLRQFEKWYLLIAGMIVSYAIIFADAWRSNLFAQTLITERRNTESFSGWFLALAASVSGLGQAILEDSTLSTIYAARSAVSSASILCLMWYYHQLHLRTMRT